MINFSNVYKYTVGNYPKSHKVFITLYEIRDNLIEFFPKVDQTFGFIVNNRLYSRFEFYKEFKHYTYRYNTLVYEISIHEDLEYPIIDRDYIKALISIHTEPSRIYRNVGRFQGTREPAKYDNAVAAKLKALNDFKNYLYA